MIRLMILAMALVSATACVAPDGPTSSVVLATGSPGFECVNAMGNDGVQCIGAISSFNCLVRLDVPDVGTLEAGNISILQNDLGYILAADSKSLDYGQIANDLMCVTRDDFLNKFDILVSSDDICVSNLSFPGPPICGCR